MFNKSFLVNKIVNTLISNNFEVFVTAGCFDVAAKNEKLLLIKALINIDGLNQQQALSLKAISYFVSASPFIVSLKTNRETLKDEIIYSRFELPVVTPRMFDMIIEEETIPYVKSTKGKHLTPIDTQTLRKKREELKLSLKQLAERAGMSKKALYEIENNRVTPSVQTVEKLEEILKTDLRLAYKPEPLNATYLKPKDKFEERIRKEFVRIGIDNSSVYSAPFEIVGKTKKPLITSLSKDEKKIKKNVFTVKKLSFIFSSECTFIAKKFEESSVEGVPIILEEELSDINSAKEFDKLLREKV